MVLVSVANYGLLRRHLGLSLADSLADRLVGHMAGLVPVEEVAADPARSRVGPGR